MTNPTAPPPEADLSAADDDAKQLIADLQIAFKRITGWRPWASDSGALYATRIEELTKGEIDAGRLRTIAADGPYDLAERIKREMALATQAEAEAEQDSAPTGR